MVIRLDYDRVAMLNRFRQFWTKVIAPIANLLLKLGVSPDVVTLVGTVGVCAGALIFFPRGQLLARRGGDHLFRLLRPDRRLHGPDVGDVVEVGVVPRLHPGPARRRRGLRRPGAVLRQLERRRLDADGRGDAVGAGDGRDHVVRAGEGGEPRPEGERWAGRAGGPAGRGARDRVLLRRPQPADPARRSSSGRSRSPARSPSSSARVSVRRQVLADPANAGLDTPPQPAEPAEPPAEPDAKS